MLNPVTDVGISFSTGGAEPTPWAEGLALLEAAEVFWLTTVKSSGSPHTTPLLMVWFDDALHFCTGADEQKNVNVVANPGVTVTTGTNAQVGTDIIIEGRAERITDMTALSTAAALWKSKYGWEWRAVGGGLTGAGPQENVALLYRIAPVKGFAFRKGEVSCQTRWRF